MSNLYAQIAFPEKISEYITVWLDRQEGCLFMSGVSLKGLLVEEDQILFSSQG